MNILYKLSTISLLLSLLITYFIEGDIKLFTVHIYPLIPFIVSLIILSKKDKSELTTVTSKLDYLQKNISGSNIQLRESCEQLDESNEEQCNAVIQTSSTSEEISAMIDRTTKSIESFESNIQKINNLVVESDNTLIGLEKNIQESLDTSNNMNDSLKSIVSDLQGFANSFENVEQKVELINDIVFQTKLLSFNASVEAARAGEQGKGFAVVAEEIGKLANTSGDSANAINTTLVEANEKLVSLISNIENNSSSLRKELTVVSEKCDNSMTHFKSSFSKTRQQTEDMKNEITEITTAAQEQRNGVFELKEAIYSINNSTQKNTLVVSQTINLAETINEYLNDQKELVKKAKSHNNLNFQNLILEIPWEDKYSIGIDQMDDDHKEILKRINLLIRSMNDKADTVTPFSSLKKFTIHHFKEEENYLKEIKYPSYESHKKIHTKLVNSLERFEKQMNDGSLEQEKLASFLKNWLFTHIMGIDIKYAQHSKEYKISA